MKKLLLLFVAATLLYACQKDSTFVEDNVASVDVMVVDNPTNFLSDLIANPPMGSNSIDSNEAGKNPKHGINVRFLNGSDAFIRAYLHPTFVEKYDDGDIIVGFGWRGDDGYEVTGGIYEVYTESTDSYYYWAQDFEGLWSSDEYVGIDFLTSFDSPSDAFDDKEKFFYFTMDQSAFIGECGPEIEDNVLGGSTDITVIYNGTIDPKNAEDRGDWLRLNTNLNSIKDELAGTIIFTEDDDYLYVDYAENARVYVKGIRVVSHTTTPVTLVDGAGTEYVTNKDIIEIEFDEDSNVLSRAFQKGDLLRWFCGDVTFAEVEEECDATYETYADAIADGSFVSASYNEKINTCEGKLTVTFGNKETLSEDCGGSIHPVGTMFTLTTEAGDATVLYQVTEDTDTGDGQHEGSPITPGIYSDPCHSYSE